MEILTIEHNDFTLYIECSKFDEIWTTAKNNIGEEKLFSTYSWSEGVKRVSRSGVELQNNQRGDAVFFDNTDYPVWVEFNDNVKKASFGSILQSENDQFTFRRHVLAGFLNYGNEIGRSELRLLYEIEGKKLQFTFSYEVLSTKLDYHEHWRAIVDDIEREYRMLSLSYMRRTFHGFSPDKNGETPEIVWWSIFSSEQNKFIRACKNIIERPHHRLKGSITYKRADQLTYIPINLENEIAEHRKDIKHLYRVEERVQTNDTQENRFLKFAINQISDKYERLKRILTRSQNISTTFREEIQLVSRQLMHLKRNPFFRTVGRFKGMNQENMVLQKASSYNQVYRTWNLLRRAYTLNDGMYRLQTKDIATLYEIWCFIEVSHIVKEKLHLRDEDLVHRNRKEMNGLFTWELGKGEHSRILFNKDGVELAELIYNPKNTAQENNETGMSNIVVPTVPQKPDIVLQLTKNDLQNNLKMTYLFDAKYRIDGKDSNGVDTPPDDAINQMHRYRDAIYYQKVPQDKLKKEVIGGYILFPGNGEPQDILLSKFHKSIEEVNIGAFPLRPKDENNRKMLGDFIDKLIAEPSAKTISEVIPQKGAIVEVGDRVLIGVVKRDLDSFLNRQATLYYTGKKFPTTISLDGLYFFMPYIPKMGIRDAYIIKRIRTISAKEAKKLGEESTENDTRLAFEIEYNRQVLADFHKIQLSIDYSFTDTTFAEIQKSYNTDKAN